MVFLVGQGLAPDPVVRNGVGLGFADRQEIAEGAVVPQLQGAMPLRWRSCCSWWLSQAS